MGSVTIPLRGDKEYKDAFAAVARRKGRTMADMVRQALDQVYGTDISSAAVFFASDGQHNIHTDNHKSTETQP